MKIIQRGSLKFLGLIIILNLGTSLSSEAQSYRLKMADSLFQAKRYTQSLEHYEEILRQRYYTPAMLLKMAYVHEGLNQMGSAMYYLNLYQLATDDKSVFEKIDEIASKYDLVGYTTSSADRFWSFYHDFHLWLSLSLAALIIFLASLMFRTRMRLHRRPVGSAIITAVLCVALFVHQQYGTMRSRAIIAATTTYVMDGPSAGASVIAIVGDGHRVQVLGKRDVWLRIKWDEEVAYVKENSVKPLSL